MFEKRTRNRRSINHMIYGESWKPYNRYMFGIFTLGLFGITIITITHFRFTTTHNYDENQNEIQINQFKNSKSTDDCDFTNCWYECKMTLDELAEKINSMGCTSFHDMFLSGLNFPNKVLSKNWLPENITVYHQLQISKPNLNSIENDAFNTKQFRELQILSLYTVNFEEILRKDMFNGLNMLIEFNIQNINDRPYTFEKGLLNEFQSLQTLQILNVMINEESILNLTGPGVKKIGSVSTIDYRYNTRLTNIPKDAFWATPNVVQIFLEGNSLETVDTSAFDNLNNLIKLNIKNNQFKILYKIWFPTYERYKLLYVQDNHLICNCNMKWMIKIQTNDFNASSCNTIETNEKNNLRDYLMECEPTTTTSTSPATTTRDTTTEDWPVTDPPNTPEIIPTTTISTTTTTTPSTTPTTTPIPDIIYELCGDSLNTTVYKPSNVELNINYVNYNEIDIQIKNSKDYLILTKNSKETENTSCIPNKNQDQLSIKLDAFDDTPYIFCVKHKDRAIFSIEDCYATKTPPKPENQPYILNSQKNNFILLMVGIVTLFVFITNTSLYILLRKFPNLLKNNNIVVIKPPEEFQPRIFPTYLSSFHTLNHFERNRRNNPVYLSPVSMQRRKWRYDHQITGENNSSRNTLASYVTVIEPPTDFHHSTWNNDLYTYSMPPMVPPRPIFPRKKFRLNPDFRPSLY